MSEKAKVKRQKNRQAERNEAERSEVEAQIRNLSNAINTINQTLPKLYEQGVVCWIDTNRMHPHPFSPVISIKADLRGSGITITQQPKQ